MDWPFTVAVAVWIVVAGGLVGAIVGAVVGVEPVPPEVPAVVELPQAARSITTRRLLANKSNFR